LFWCFLFICNSSCNSSFEAFEYSFFRYFFPFFLFLLCSIAVLDMF
jgi:hypothetical protein